MAKEIFCSFGIDVDAVAGWLGSYGGEDSPDDISRGLFSGEVGSPRLLKLFEIVWISLGSTSAGSAGVGAFKTAMRSLGIIASKTMARPQRSLNDEETAKVEMILRDVGLLR